MKKLRFVPPLESDGKPIVHLDSNKFKAVHKEFENMVIGGLWEEGYQYVKDATKGIWKLKNKFIMKVYGERLLSLEFAIEEDMLKVLEIGCFHIAS